jgi:lambda family phage portal protein
MNPIMGGSSLTTLNLQAPSRATAAPQSKRSFVFEGASGNRLTLDWIAPILSPDQEFRGNARLLRGRGRELVRNNPIAKHFLNLLATNVIGATGIRYRARVRNNDGKLNRLFNRKIEASFKEWSKKGNCTVDGKHSLRAFDDLVLRTVAMDGEGFVQMVSGFNNKWGFALKLIDADQVDHNFSRAPERGSNEIRLGVEVNADGKPVAYYINPGHPSDYGGSLLRTRVPAEQIIHVMDPYRVNQTRGITWFHPVMVTLKMLHGYHEAELVAARVGAAKAGFFEYTDAATALAEYDSPNPDTPLRMEANAGVYEKLPPGLKFVANNSDHPAQAFENFIKANVRLVASGVGASYNSLANDLQGVNYSSLRSGLLIERDHWCVTQQWYIEDSKQPVFDAWLPMALLSGALVLDSRDPARFSEGAWLPRGWRWVDPLKDSQGAIIDIASCLDSPQRIVAERGDDIEEILEEREEFEKMCKEHSITVNLNPPSRPSTENNPAETEGEADEADVKDDAKEGASEDAKGDRAAADLVPHTLAMLTGKKLQ